jgi:hypothetical protein
MLAQMLRPLAFAVAIGLPTVALAQRPETPNERASEQAHALVALHRATHRRGSVVRFPAGRASDAALSGQAGRASPFGDGPDDQTQATASGQPISLGRPQAPALPAAPARKNGPSTNHRP